MASMATDGATLDVSTDDLPERDRTADSFHRGSHISDCIDLPGWRAAPIAWIGNGHEHTPTVQRWRDAEAEYSVGSFALPAAFGQLASPLQAVADMIDGLTKPNLRLRLILSPKRRPVYVVSGVDRPSGRAVLHVKDFRSVKDRNCHFRRIAPRRPSWSWVDQGGAKDKRLETAGSRGIQQRDHLAAGVTRRWLARLTGGSRADRPKSERTEQEFLRPHVATMSLATTEARMPLRPAAQD